MRTLVVSDLHLGARLERDVLRRAPALEALLDALGDVDRLVLLGDVVELLEQRPRRAMDDAEPVLRAIGARLGVGREAVVVPGNHDAALPPDATPALARLTSWLAPAAVEVRYPGVWLRDGVWATHGHYLDRHVTIPGFERLASGVLGRLLGAPADHAASPDDYEVVLAPMYALLDAVAARVADGRAAAPGNASARAWRRLSGDGTREWRARVLAGAFPVGIGALNRIGIGPLKADLSGVELRRASLRAMGEVVARLRIDARHVIFGHTHRFGPLPDDELGEWRLSGGATVLNIGCWVYESMYLDRHWGNPYWPGGAAMVDASGEGGRVRLLRLLEGVDARELRPQGVPVPA